MLYILIKQGVCESVFLCTFSRWEGYVQRYDAGKRGALRCIQEHRGDEVHPKTVT